MHRFLIIIILFLIPSIGHAQVPATSGTLSDKFIISWVEENVEKVMNFKKGHQDNSMEEKRKFFTEQGYLNFTDSVKKSRILEMLEYNSQELSATLQSQPKILQKEQRLWYVLFPITFHYKGTKKSRQDNICVLLAIRKSDYNLNISGIGIDQWISSLNGSESVSICSNETRDNLMQKASNNTSASAPKDELQESTKELEERLEKTPKWKIWLINFIQSITGGPKFE